MSPINDIKSDLLEAQILYANPHSKLLVNLIGRPKPKPIQRVFLTGANPFVLTTEKLLQIAELIHKYFSSVDSIGCFARITDSANKTNKAFGITSLYWIWFALQLSIASKAYNIKQA